jgi:hypothetical protein
MNLECIDSVYAYYDKVAVQTYKGRIENLPVSRYGSTGLYGVPVSCGLTNVLTA